MTFAQGMLLIAIVGFLMIFLDFILGKLFDDWKTTSWEEDEFKSNY